MNRLLSALALAALITGSACSAPTSVGSVSPQTLADQSSARHTQDVTGGGGGFNTAAVTVDLYDAALQLGPNAQVNVAIEGVDVVSDGTEYPLVSYASAQIVNLLQLQQVADAIQGQLPAGSYDSLELLVDPSQSTLVNNGTTYPMVFRSGRSKWGTTSSRRRSHSQSTLRGTQDVVGGGGGFMALVAPVSFSASSGGSVSLAVDFNVLESVTVANGVAIVTANLAAADQPSAVNGVVQNQAGQPVVNATIIATDSNGNVDNTTTTASDGSFTLHALNSGAYTISVVNSYTSASGNTVTASGNDPNASPSVPIDLAPSDQLNIGTLID
ncbi:MAG TPA: DUF4382 domain-containing protein [Candidatus Sulfotelmatobacter sp.]|nr:DUF4382 domain-containing protein [Candidatus Sulfotelmatobacter sp.]